MAANVFGTFMAGLFLLGAGALFALNPVASGRNLLRFSLLMVLPLLALASSFWSDSPERTVRAGLQIVATMAAAIIICTTLPRDRLVTILFVGMFAVALLALPTIPGAALNGQPLLGPFASKNIMAYTALTLFGLAFTILVDGKRSAKLRLIGLAAFIYALVVVGLAQSAGAYALLAMTAIIFPLFLIFSRFNFAMRVALVILAVVIMGAAASFLPEIEAAGGALREGVLNKDATLTGRTYLWDFAFRMSAERPWLGHGYYAFWRIGNIDAEGLWRYAGIRSRTGFNFHNSFVEMLVDMGRIGVAVLVLTCAGIVGSAFLRQVREPTVAMTFLLSMTVVQLVRSYAETTLFGPFSLETLLLIATAVYAFPRHPAKDAATRPTRGFRNVTPRAVR
jgi:exopolysaccharide production protein ExoQ